MLNSKRMRTVVGLEIEADSVAAAEVRTNGSATLGKYGIAPLSPGLFRDGEVADPVALSASLKSFFGEHKLSRNVRVGIANQRVIVRSLRLPVLDNPDEIDAAIRFQARDHIPMDLDDAVVDWQVLEDDPELRRRGQMDVVVVAARRQTIDAVMSALTTAGLKPVGIDIAAFAMVRALSQADELNAIPVAENWNQDEGAVAPPVARLLCNFGDVLNIAVARGSSCLFTRVSTFGIEGITQRLAESRGLTLDHARQWLLHVGARRPVEEIEGDPEIVRATREILLEGLSRLAGEIRLSSDYYGAQEGAVAFEEIVICGTGSAIDGVAEQIESEVGRRVRIVVPAGLKDVNPHEGARLTLPYGLGLEA